MFNICPLLEVLNIEVLNIRSTDEPMRPAGALSRSIRVALIRVNRRYAQSN
jgi:hypothetical protein